MYINIDTPISEIQELLIQIGCIDPDKEQLVAIETPGEGNMNVVLRVTTTVRSFIVKQSRPYVQKYQEIDAPIERIDVEYQFYKTIVNKEIMSHIPDVLCYNEANYILVLKDLVQCKDMSYLYEDRSIKKRDFDDLVAISAIIHKAEVTKSYPENKELRLLNHQHIFVLPFEKENGFDLDAVQDGLQALSLEYKNDEHLKNIITEVGDRYLSEGDTLIHGDYYPGSWMTKLDHIYVIDPEFSFKGFAEFDLGVLVAHAVMITGDKSFLEKTIDQYPATIDKDLVSKVAGIEIMRRLIGLAQLPLDRTIDEKTRLLTIAYDFILVS